MTQYFRLRLYDSDFNTLSALWVFSDCSLTALIALWVISDLERWRFIALDKFEPYKHFLSSCRSQNVVVSNVQTISRHRFSWGCGHFITLSLKIMIYLLKPSPVYPVHHLINPGPDESEVIACSGQTWPWPASPLQSRQSHPGHWPLHTLNRRRDKQFLNVKVCLYVLIWIYYS